VSEPPARPHARPEPGEAARPPLGGWGRLYAWVIVALLADVALLWWLTERYR